MSEDEEYIRDVEAEITKLRQQLAEVTAQRDRMADDELKTDPRMQETVMTNIKTLTYHNSQELKDQAVADAKRHVELDMLRAGDYGQMNGQFHGCSVGCDAYEIKKEVVNHAPHVITSEYFGFPEWLEHLRDAIFEELPDEDKKDWHIRLKEAVPVGVDLEPVRHQLAIRRLNMLIDAQTQALESAIDGHGVKDVVKQVLAALQHVRVCHEAEIRQDHCMVDWSAAESAVESAVESAAWSARSAAWKQEAEDLLDLLQEAQENSDDN